MITSLNDLKAVLKIRKQDEQDEAARLGTTPESVANSIGNTAGKNM